MEEHEEAPEAEEEGEGEDDGDVGVRRGQADATLLHVPGQLNQNGTKVNFSPAVVRIRSQFYRSTLCAVQ